MHWYVIHTSQIRQLPIVIELNLHVCYDSSTHISCCFVELNLMQFCEWPSMSLNSIKTSQLRGLPLPHTLLTTPPCFSGLSLNYFSKQAFLLLAISHGDFVCTHCALYFSFTVIVGFGFVFLGGEQFKHLIVFN